jgi:LacI family transcriptional regulator
MDDIVKRVIPPEVVLCSNDDWAIGALTACGEAGARVPEDIAITGFDDSPIGRFGMVPLTTVAQQPQLMASQAVEILVRKIRGESMQSEEPVLKTPCQVVVRRSCGCAGRSASATLVTRG